MPAPWKGLDWMFDYSDLFDSFNMPPTFSDEDVVVQMMYDAQNAPDEPMQLSSASIPTQIHDDSSDVDEDPVQPVVPEPIVENVVHDLEDLNLSNLDPQVDVPAHLVGRIDRIIIGSPSDGVKTRNQL
ncbi:hypothetical protein R6Q57_013153 [Mikania cordata]